MCSVVILYRPHHGWPLLLAANRDEMLDRPWDAPARHWPERPRLTAGRDRLAGGTWLGLNDDGVIAGVLNRRHSLGPGTGYLSRGELPLLALEQATAASAAEAVSRIDAAAYRPFNMVVADDRGAFWLRSTGALEVSALAPGLSMITAYDLNDRASPRMRLNLPRFEAAAPPDPEAGDWSAWTGLLADRLHEDGAGPGGAMNVVTDRGFGTVSSSLMALPAAGRARWLFAAGRPGEADYLPVLS